MDGVPVVTKKQASFLTQLPERKETAWDFTMRPTVALKQLQSLIAVIQCLAKVFIPLGIFPILLHYNL
jgi:hypothetical protein